MYSHVVWGHRSSLLKMSSAAASWLPFPHFLSNDSHDSTSPLVWMVTASFMLHTSVCFWWWQGCWPPHLPLQLPPNTHTHFNKFTQLWFTTLVVWTMRKNFGQCLCTSSSKKINVQYIHCMRWWWHIFLHSHSYAALPPGGCQRNSHHCILCSLV